MPGPEDSASLDARRTTSKDDKKPKYRKSGIIKKEDGTSSNCTSSQTTARHRPNGGHDEDNWIHNSREPADGITRKLTSGKAGPSCSESSSIAIYGRKDIAIAKTQKYGIFSKMLNMMTRQSSKKDEGPAAKAAPGQVYKVEGGRETASKKLAGMYTSIGSKHQKRNAFRRNDGAYHLFWGGSKHKGWWFSASLGVVGASADVCAFNPLDMKEPPMDGWLAGGVKKADMKKDALKVTFFKVIEPAKTKPLNQKESMFVRFATTSQIMQKQHSEVTNITGGCSFKTRMFKALKPAWNSANPTLEAEARQRPFRRLEAEDEDHVCQSWTSDDRRTSEEQAARVVQNSVRKHNDRRVNSAVMIQRNWRRTKSRSTEMELIACHSSASLSPTQWISDASSTSPTRGFSCPDHVGGREACRSTFSDAPEESEARGARRKGDFKRKKPKQQHGNVGRSRSVVNLTSSADDGLPVRSRSMSKVGSGNNEKEGKVKRQGTGFQQDRKKGRDKAAESGGVEKHERYADRRRRQRNSREERKHGSFGSVCSGSGTSRGSRDRGDTSRGSRDRGHRGSCDSSRDRSGGSRDLRECTSDSRRSEQRGTRARPHTPKSPTRRNRIDVRDELSGSTHYNSEREMLEVGSVQASPRGNYAKAKSTSRTSSKSRHDGLRSPRALITY